MNMNNNIEWVHWPDPKAVTKGFTNLSKFSEAYVKRQEQYPNYKPSNEALDIAKETVKIKAKVLWLQLGIRNDAAKAIVELKNIKYVENRCTKMEYQKLFLKVAQAFPVLINR